MSEHVADDLPRLLTGEATRDETVTAAAHLRSCPDCQDELVSALVAHASLASARRFAPDLLARASTPAPVDEPAGPLPDLSEVFRQTRSEARAESSRHRGRRLLAGAAAVVVLAGGGIALAETLGSSGPATPSAQTITLQPVGANHAGAKATVSAGTMRVDASALPSLDQARQYEVWLADASGQQLRALGFIGTDRTASLPVPRNVMTRYTAVAISIQRSDQVAFSGDLVARGSYG